MLHLIDSLLDLEERSAVQKCTFLSDLLPYDPAVKIGNRLKDGLKEFLLLLNATEAAIKSLEKGELKHFDPIVGENACQIRAVKIALIYLNYENLININKLMRDISVSRAGVEELLATIPNFSKSDTSLKYYLENQSLDVSVNDDELFLIKSFLLSKVKVMKPFNLEKPLVENAGTDAKQIKEFSNVGSAFSWNFVRNLREKLSASSVKFVQEMAVKSINNKECDRMVSSKFSIIHNGLKCLPYYWTARVLMELALSYRIPIVMIAEQRAKDLNYTAVRKTALFFKATADGYQEVDRFALNSDEPALILVGSTCRNFTDLPSTETWIQELLEHCLDDIILAYAASHRQYPDQEKDLLISEIKNENYCFHKEKAIEWGCSLENPSLFFLAHAYCDKIRNVKEYL